jgi:hypothetical protein
VPEVLLSVEELALAVGISPNRLMRLVGLGVVEPIEPNSSQFTDAAAPRLRRMLRLHRDLGVNIIGAAVIVDLVERLEDLQTQLRDHR